MATPKSTKKTATGIATRSRKTGSTTSGLTSSGLEGAETSTAKGRSSSSNQSGSKRKPTNITGYGSMPVSRTKSTGETSEGNKSAGARGRTGSNRGSGQMQNEVRSGSGKKSQRNIQSEHDRNPSEWRGAPNRGSMYQEGEYRRSGSWREDDNHREQYYRDRQMRSNYENDRNSGRNQERYGENERNTQRERFGNRYDQQENFHRYTGSGSGRTSYGDNRGYRGNQEYYYPDERRTQRSEGRMPYQQQMETYGDDRQASRFSRNRRTMPTGKNDEGLRKLFTDQLKDMYWAEKALTKAIPKMIKNASGKELVRALNEHLYVTEDQVQKLESIFRMMGQKASAKKCEAMEGLIKEAEDMIKEMDAGSVRDAGIICAGQKVEHYEIATYGCLSTYAGILGETEIVDILEEILAEEKRADKTLTRVATRINWEAATEENDEDTEEEEDEKEEEEEEDQEDDGDQIQGTERSAKS